MLRTSIRFAPFGGWIVAGNKRRPTTQYRDVHVWTRRNCGRSALSNRETIDSRRESRQIIERYEIRRLYFQPPIDISPFINPPLADPASEEGTDATLVASISLRCRVLRSSRTSAELSAGTTGTDSTPNNTRDRRQVPRTPSPASLVRPVLLLRLSFRDPSPLSVVADDVC